MDHMIEKQLNSPVIIKFTQNHDMNKNECQVLKKLSERSSDKNIGMFPQLISFG